VRKVVVAAFLSLDGVMQAPGGPEEDPSGGFEQGGWLFGYWDEIMGQVMDQSFAQPFDLLLGRRTYEIFAAHWPYIENDPVADKFNACAKYVATSEPEKLTWKNSQPLRGDVAGAIAKLKQEDGPLLLTQGSGVLVQSLLEHDLIDEFRLWFFPVVLGSGKRLFGSGAKPAGLKLADSQTSTTGVLMNTYLPAGAIKAGSFALENPSDAELERRRKLAAEA
jgi:dihydrofolate reductase